MKSLKLVLAVCIIVIFYASSALAESTATRHVSQIHADGSSQDFYATAQEGGWGSPTCPNATYVYVANNVADRKSLLALTLATKMANLPVRFTGYCNADPTYFNATYIIVGP